MAGWHSPSIPVHSSSYLTAHPFMCGGWDSNGDDDVCLLCECAMLDNKICQRKHTTNAGNAAPFFDKWRKLSPRTRPARAKQKQTQMIRWPSATSRIQSSQPAEQRRNATPLLPIKHESSVTGHWFLPTATQHHHRLAACSIPLLGHGK